MPQAEEILTDRWVLVEKIDEGAMGEIFRGRHEVLGHAVAIKVLIPTITRDKSATERFLREARIAAKLQHPNVVRVEDFGVARDGRPFLVMELLRGESLARRLAREPRLTSAEVLEIVRQIGAALDTAHAAGIVHRDLKPENVFLAREGEGSTVKVLDFGVAKFTDVLANGGHATASNTLVGTPRYMSPEQARSSRELDGRSDLWALGMLAYEALTGSHPFEGEAIAEILVAILTHRIAPPSSVAAHLPPALDVWATRALARSRGERFATGRALADALADALAGRLDQPWAVDLIEMSSDASGEPRRATLRVPRPSPQVDDEVGAATEPTPREGPAPVTLSTDAVPDATERPVVPSGRSWWAIGLVAALTVGLTLFAATVRTSRPVAVSNVRGLPSQAPFAPDVPAAAAPRADPPVVATEPLPPVATGPAPPPSLSPAASVPAPTRHRVERPRRPGVREGDRVPVPAASGSARQGRGLYDPTGI